MDFKRTLDMFFTAEEETTFIYLFILLFLPGSVDFSFIPLAHKYGVKNVTVKNVTTVFF